jgi:hypothetical protein
VLTLAVEWIVAFPLLAPTGAGPARRLGVVMLGNLATHPLVWFAFPQLRLSGAERLVLSELFALSAETCTYLVVWPMLGPARAFGTSAVANGASLAVGLSLRALGFGV